VGPDEHGAGPEGWGEVGGEQRRRPGSGPNGAGGGGAPPSAVSTGNATSMG
jgi:hypothetical protein